MSGAVDYRAEGRRIDPESRIDERLEKDPRNYFVAVGSANYHMRKAQDDDSDSRQASHFGKSVDILVSRTKYIIEDINGGKIKPCLASNAIEKMMRTYEDLLRTLRDHGCESSEMYLKAEKSRKELEQYAIINGLIKRK